VSPAVNPTTLLRDRLDLLRRRLDFVRTALPAGIRVAEDLTIKIDGRQKEVDGHLEFDQADAYKWHSLAKLEDVCKPLFRDALAVLQGNPGLASGGPATLSESLCDELSAACRLGITPAIVLDMDDSFSDGAQIIRLRFPPADIWDVPVVAHEFGHFAAYRLTGAATDGRLRRPQAVRMAIDDYLRVHNVEDAEQGKWDDWLNEIFGDIFATYVLGPAFAFSALLLRFDAEQAFTGREKHPSYAARGKAILRTLQLMDTDGQFELVLNWLTKRWESLLKLAGPGTEPTWVEEPARSFHAALVQMAGQAQYAGWKCAERTLQYAFNRPYTDPRQEFCPRDLLNGAWLAHINLGRSLPDVSDRALQMWKSATKTTRTMEGARE
jgi:hypothetical protein